MWSPVNHAERWRGPQDCPAVSFAALKDKAEFEYLNNLPTSFILPSEVVDRLRAAAGTIILSSSEFKRMVKDADFDLATDPPTTGSATTEHEHTR